LESKSRTGLQILDEIEGVRKMEIKRVGSEKLITKRESAKLGGATLLYEVDRRTWR
jgi:hypothetical protein